MNRPEPLVFAAALSSALVAGLVVAWVAPPPRRLRSRVAPYLTPRPPVREGRDALFTKVFGPLLWDLAERVGSILDRSAATTIALMLRQAGWYQGLEEDEMVTRYRLKQVSTLAVGVLVGLAASRVISAGVGPTLALGILGGVVGASRPRGRLQSAIDARRELMNVEIYTVNQLLAMRVRVGGGVVGAVSALVTRGRGEVVGELAEALRLHRAGWSGPAAFRRIAELTPEPFCARTYRLLATAEERGADLAGALLALSEDVRESRREALKRAATKRRAAMLVPTIAILAPVLILFVAAPLPYLITSWL
ncbi:MAG TPA: type II secretion system F family protein [Acidimicrobiia bacterium]